MICNKCGATVAPQSNECRFCGSVVTDYPQNQLPPIPMMQQQVVYVNQPPAYVAKSKVLTLLLCLFMGCWGIHRFYVGKIGTGILWLCTFGMFGIGIVVDLISIAIGSFRDKEGHALE